MEFSTVGRIKDYSQVFEIGDLLNVMTIYAPGMALGPSGKCHGFGFLIIELLADLHKYVFFFQPVLKYIYRKQNCTINLFFS